jgi:hypothetical protein
MVVGLVFLGGMTGFAPTLGLYLQLGPEFTPLAAGLTRRSDDSEPVLAAQAQL